MLKLNNINKSYKTNHGTKKVLNDVSLVVNNGEKLGILGRNGAGKSTLIRIISGAEKASSGTVEYDMSISWPLAFSGAFQGGLTGFDNAKFISRIYNADIKKVVKYVEEFAELGEYLYEPVKKYSSGMRARLAFALSLAIEFECFLIDEVVAVGDQKFHNKCKVELFEKNNNKAMIIVSHDIHYIKEHCTRASVLHNGELKNFTNVEDAIMFYEKNL